LLKVSASSEEDIYSVGETRICAGADAGENPKISETERKLSMVIEDFVPNVKRI
jgi:hypothetical protein